MRTMNEDAARWQTEPPMGLTRKEKKKPVKAMVDFFECYQLNEARAVLWDWMVEVVTSDGCIAETARQRSDAIFFYERLSVLIEAAFLVGDRHRQSVMPPRA